MSLSKTWTTPALESFINLNKSYAGRDKSTKAIQYGARLIMYVLLSSDPKSDLGNRFKGLFAMSRDARKLWRFCNPLTEFKTILAALDSTKESSLVQSLTVLSRTSFACYWIFDVLVYLCKAKFLTRDPTEFGLHANRGWFFGILFGIFIQVINLRDNFEKESKTAEGSDARATVLKDRTSIYLKLIAGFGDLPVAANGFNLTQAMLGKQFNDGVMGAGGLTSALIGAYQLL